jgi:2-(1,2-epoxy-1,2-dihydrophenyl)acetyl-CoA isomerase
VPAAELMTAAMEMAARIARGPANRLSLHEAERRAASLEAYQAVLDREAFTQCWTGSTADHREGVAAFKAKRAPQFGGR